MIVFLQRSGWRQSQSREEGQRWVWVCLGNEHSHLVLLSHPGERCVCLCHCNAFIFPVTLWSPQLLTSCHWEHSRCVWGVGSWLCVDVACFYVCVLQALALCRASRPWRAQWSAVWGRSSSTFKNSTWSEFLEVKGTWKQTFSNIACDCIHPLFPLSRQKYNFQVLKFCYQ